MPALSSDQSSSPYLPPSAARGCAYCFDPDSALLRRALTQPRPKGDTPIPSDSLLADLVFLHRLMQKQYAGYPDLLQHRDFDPESFFADWMATVRSAGPQISFREGIVEPLVDLRRAVPDNHLTFLGADAVLEGDERITCHEFQALLPGGLDPCHLGPCSLPEAPGARASTLRSAPMLRPDGSMVTVLTLSAAGSAATLAVRCGERSIQLNRRPAAPIPHGSPPGMPAYEWRGVGDTTLVTLRSFAGSTAAGEQLRRLAADYAAHATRPKILFDLRDNGGGSLQHVHAWIGKAHRGEWRSYPRLEVAGALWPCSLWNVVVERQIREGRVDTAEARSERDRLRASWPSQPPGQSAHLDPGYRRSEAADPYTGRVFVLVNRNSGSSGELAAVELKRALNAVIVGERSDGVMQYGEARRFALPRTGLVCQLPTKRFFFDEEVESVGWPVDCYLERIDDDAANIIPSLDLVHQTLSAYPTAAPPGR